MITIGNYARCVFFAVAVVMSFPACGRRGIEGTYEFSGITMQLASDGTYKMKDVKSYVVNGELGKGTYKIDGNTITITSSDGTRTSGTLGDGYFTLLGNHWYRTDMKRKSGPCDRFIGIWSGTVRGVPFTMFIRPDGDQYLVRIDSIEAPGAAIVGSNLVPCENGRLRLPSGDATLSSDGRLYYFDGEYRKQE